MVIHKRVNNRLNVLKINSSFECYDRFTYFGRPSFDKCKMQKCCCFCCCCKNLVFGQFRMMLLFHLWLIATEFCLISKFDWCCECDTFVRFDIGDGSSIVYRPKKYFGLADSINSFGSQIHPSYYRLMLINLPNLCTRCLHFVFPNYCIILIVHFYWINTQELLAGCTTATCFPNVLFIFLASNFTTETAHK